jgi:adenosylcobinamide-GDP ribazoletransferase
MTGRDALLAEARVLLTAVQYFTRVPVPAWVGHGTAQLNACLRWFPAVGLAVGASCAAVYAAVAALTTVPVGVVAAMFAGVLLTGGFHEDGLADSADGFGGGWTRAQVLEIMKDSRVGSYAVIALVLVLLGRFALLTSLGAATVAALVAGHGVSRWLAASMVWQLDYVRLDDRARARPVAEQLGGGSLALAALPLLPALAWLGTASAGGLLPALAMRWALGRYVRRRLGGYTGDCLGATQQLTELAFYLGVLATPGLLARATTP